MPSKPRKSASSSTVANSEVVHRAELDELERARERLGLKSGRLGRLPASKRRSKETKDTAGGSGGISSDAVTAALTFFAGSCIAAFIFFTNPYYDSFEAYRMVNAIALLWLPWLLITLFLKQDLQQFGATRGDKKFGLKWTAIGIVAMLPVLVVISLQRNFQSYYGNMLGQPLANVEYAVYSGIPLPGVQHVRPLGLLYYELGQGFYFFCWEFFFRGFLLFGLARARFIGSIGAILLQAIPFALLHWSVVPSASKPPLEIASAFFGGLILGWLALRTKTFFYGFLIHWAIAGILDFLLVARVLLHAG